MRMKAKHNLTLFIGLSSIVLLGMGSALWLFNAIPQLSGAGPMALAPTTTLLPNKTLTIPIVSTTPLPTPIPTTLLDADCLGSTTTLENAHRIVGFKLLEPSRLPANLQFSGVTINRLYPSRNFEVLLSYRNLQANAMEPYVTISQRLVSSGSEVDMLTPKISFLAIRGAQGQFIEYDVLPTLPPMLPTPIPNPTLLAFTPSPHIIPTPLTPTFYTPCSWVVIATPVLWTPTPMRATSTHLSITPTPWRPAPQLRWIENGVWLIVSGTYGREELLKVAESLK